LISRYQLGKMTRDSSFMILATWTPLQSFQGFLTLMVMRESLDTEDIRLRNWRRKAPLQKCHI